MYRSNVRFLDLSNEILYIILKKLDNIDVLYSLLDVDNQRLNMIVKEKTFTNTLNFVLTTSTDEILSITDPILDRFCISILPKINHNVKSLILGSESMERIYLAADYPNLTELKLFNFTDKIASCYFTDCLALLDGRLKQLTTFNVIIDITDSHSSVVYNMDSLPNLKCFSLTCRCYTNEYDSQVLPLLHRMSNLEELTLDIVNHDRTTFVDGTQIHNQILVHMPRLHKFNFHINTRTELNLVHDLSSDDIQRTFTNIGYEH
ncbi:unnamed protein product, partial [Rotaria sp. Silwood1]